MVTRAMPGVDAMTSVSSNVYIARDAIAARLALNSLMDCVQQHGLNDFQQFAIRLAAEEALVNALKHGNKHDPHKRVWLSYKVATDAVEISVADEGEGFAPTDVPDPTNGNRLEVPSGRGLLLMRAFMSCVKFNDAGNKVVMKLDRMN